MMSGLTFPGDCRAEIREFEKPEPGPTEALIHIKASGLCGSDLPSYRAPDGLRAVGTNDTIAAGHEPAGVVEAVGSLVTRFKPGDRVLAYHILGCGYCHNCRLGYPVMCTSPARAAYGGHRNGGHAEFMVAEERSLISLPDAVSFIDGAMVACGVSTAYAACVNAGVAAGDRVVVTGLGPVGLSVAMFAADRGATVIGVDPNTERAEYARNFGVTHAVSTLEGAVDRVRDLTGGTGAEVAIECSGNDSGRHLCLEGAGSWGRVVYVGFGGTSLTFDVGWLVIQKQLTIKGSWVSSLGQMENVLDVLVRRDLHPDSMIVRQFALNEGAEAYKLFNAGSVGKIAIVA